MGKNEGSASCLRRSLSEEVINQWGQCFQGHVIALYIFKKFNGIWFSVNWEITKNSICLDFCHMGMGKNNMFMLSPQDWVLPFLFLSTPWEVEESSQRTQREDVAVCLKRATGDKSRLWGPRAKESAHLWKMFLEGKEAGREETYFLHTCYIPGLYVHYLNNPGGLLLLL